MLYLGIDIGGTSVKGAAVDECGNMLETFSMPIDKKLNQYETIDNLILVVKEYLTKNNLSDKISKIGIGVPGAIDSKKGICMYSNNLKWDDLHIAEIFEKALGYEVKISNDANAAALGEATFGAGKKYKNMVMLTLGTGVGGGIIIDGKIYDGHKGIGAELGHSLLEVNGRLCTCGRKGCLEAYASATALINMAHEALANHPESKLGEILKNQSKLTAKDIFDAADENDATARKLVEQYMYYLCEGVVNMNNIFRPECIVLAGGVANQGAKIINVIQDYLNHNSFGTNLNVHTEILHAELGYCAGIIGAACLVM